MNAKLLLGTLALVLLLAGSPAGAAAPAGTADDSVPMKVTADKMHYNHADQSITFEGSVAASREEFRLWAKKIVVYLAKGATEGLAQDQAGQAKGGKTPGESVDRIEATGAVRMEREGRTGECENAVYQVREGLLTMRGNPVLREGQNQIHGETIKFFLKENRSEVLGGPKSKVEATFITPKGMKTP